MLLHPQFDPVAFSLGPLSVRWYGLMYLLAFVQFILLGRARIKRHPGLLSVEQLDDLLWQGGMSFHGGFLGVLLAMLLWTRKHQYAWLDITDFIAPLVPLGLAAGRVGNFINGELWGRVSESSLPWAMVFPQAGDLLPRHPSQLYHVGLEGIALFLILWLYTRSVRPRGAASGVFLIGYGVFRFITEFFREPDAGIFGQSYSISMGQWLSLPMILIGLLLLTMAYRKRA